MRHDVTPERVDRFLTEMGRRLRNPARIILTGGAYMLVRGLRGQTADIDLAYEIAPEHDSELERAVRDLKEDLSINVEFAEPGHFMPMPAGRESRREYFGRFGSIDVFLDDPYAIALSKLGRGHDKDLKDVAALAAGARIDFARLEEMVREVAKARQAGARRVDLDQLLDRLALVREGRI
jgi:hypothetical protein